MTDDHDDEVRLRVDGESESGVADISIFDCGYSAPMKEDYGVTYGAEIIVTVDGGRLEVVDADDGEDSQPPIQIVGPDDDSADDPIPDDFDYGDRRPDGQFENYPTIDDGDFQQAVRSTYVHDVDDCGAKTTMTGDLPESVARAPDAYGKTFCKGCGLHVPVDEVVWDEDGQDWVMDDPYPGGDPDA